MVRVAYKRRQLAHRFTKTYRCFVGGQCLEVLAAVLRDWSRELAEWQPLFLRQGAIWHVEAPKEVPGGRILIIADDAHRFSELTKLLALGCELFETRGCKLVVCARPSGQADIDEAVARTFDAPNVLRLSPLESLELQDSEELAEEVLGPKHGHFARQLAVISGDAALVTVVGGRLIAQNRVSPLLMTTEDEFRRAVFDKYIVEYERLLPGDPLMWRGLLSLIAALSPLAVNDSRFLGRAAAFLRIRQDEILRATETLVRHGLLSRQGGAVRIVPDVLSDYLLEQACVQSDGEPTRFADEVFANFEATHLASLLRNLAELDWRITQKRAASSDLLRRVWARFFGDYQDADAGGRCTMIESFKDAAFFQPARAMELANYSMTHPVPRSGEVGWLERGQTDILHKLPGVLQNVAYNGGHLDGAIKLLWALAKQDVRDTNPHPGHALRVLQELASYGRYKGIGFNLRIADCLSELLMDPSAFDSRYTPLDVVDELLEKEGEHQESDGLTIKLGAFALAYDRVRVLRQKAFNMVETCLAMQNPRASSRAVISLSKVLSGLAPRFGRTSTDEELLWQDAERMEALAIIERRLNREPWRSDQARCVAGGTQRSRDSSRPARDALRPARHTPSARRLGTPTSRVIVNSGPSRKDGQNWTVLLPHPTDHQKTRPAGHGGTDRALVGAILPDGPKREVGAADLKRVGARNQKRRRASCQYR